MKVLVTIEAKFEVEVDTHSPESAVRAVERNWDSYYCHQAKWANGVAPQHQHRRVIMVQVPGPEEEQ